MSFKEKFEGYSLREISMLYITVVLFSILFFIMYKNSIVYINISENKNNQLSKKVITPVIRLSDVELLKYFNTNTEKLHIDLEEMNISQKMTTIKIIGTYQNMMNFLMIISQNFDILQFEVEAVLDKVFISIGIKSNTFYTSKSKPILKDKFMNPFFPTTENKSTTILPIKINAIINDEVLIYHKWYREGDAFSKYRITEINHDMVHFINIETQKEIFKSVLNE